MNEYFTVVQRILTTFATEIKKQNKMTNNYETIK